MTDPATDNAFASVQDDLLEGLSEHDKATPFTITSAQARNSWIKRSDACMVPIVKLVAGFEPEHWSAVGVHEVAERITCLPPDWAERRITAYEQAIEDLRGKQAKEEHPEIHLDIRTVIHFLEREVGVLRAETEALLPYFNLPLLLFEGFRSLLAGPPNTVRPAAARTRLRRYAGLEPGYSPLAEQAELALRTRFPQRLLGPYRRVVERDRANSEKILATIQQIFEASKVEGYESSYAALRQQLSTYHSFVDREVIPRCRGNFRLPAAVYSAKLRSFGIELPIDELASRARVAFRELRGRLEVEARQLARSRDWPDEGFPKVVQALAREKLASGKILPAYRERIRQLKELIMGSGFPPFPPQRHLEIRGATDAERLCYPFPHFRWPPLVGNRGEAGDFVLPIRHDSGPGAAEPIHDGFTCEAMSWFVAAHEAVPGHAYQFAHLLANRVPLARSLLGLDPTACEGWAIYAESEIRETLPPEARLMTLQTSLRRAVVAFLDLGLQSGTLSIDRAQWILRHKAGLSEKAAEYEIWRTTGLLPGLSVAYFCGYTQFTDLRAEVECHSGSAFDGLKYHNFLLAQGLLPLALLRERVLEALGGQERLAA